MQGQVFVPYTGIGGFNMDTGIIPFSLTGSSNPGVDSGQQGTDINVFWSLPGGLINQIYNGKSMWAYTVQSQTVDPTYDTDEDIYKWLRGELIGTSYNLTTHFSQEQIDEENPGIVSAVNELVYQYIARLLNSTDSSMDDFKRYFLDTGCYVTGRK